MFQLTNVMLLIVALVLLLAIILAVRAIVRVHREASEPFRDYFDSGYDRDLLRQSDLSESEDWQADCQSGFAPFRLRDPRSQRAENKN
jgi:uncharacterized membrane protein